MRKEKTRFHRFITYIYLPLVIALNIYIAIGNVFPLRRADLISLETIALLLPYFTVILYTLSLVGLLGLSKFGRGMILFSTIFRAVLELPLIVGELTSGGIRTAFCYAVNVAVNIVIFIYYRKNNDLFNKETLTQEKVETIEEEEEKPEEPLTFRPVGRDFSLQGLIKKIRFIYDAEKNPDTVKLLDYTLDIFAERTVIEMTVENTSGNVYTTSTWMLNNIPFTSNVLISDGKTIITIEANRVLESLSIEKVDVM